jgi:cytochrome c-type biogenesis protein CcmH
LKSFFHGKERTMSKRSKLPLILAGALIVLGLAISAAFMTGQQSPLFASGTVSIAPDLEASAKGIQTLYIVALPADGGRMPLGAARFHVSADPRGTFLNFALTPETMQLMPGSSQSGMPQSFNIKARLDTDGSGGMDQPGDLTGEATGIRLGSRDVHITIASAVK